MTVKSFYLIGSLRNPDLPDLLDDLSKTHPGVEFFCSWLAAGPEADDCWKGFEQRRGLTYKEALSDYAAQHVLAFDKRHLDRCDAAILVGPAGKSAHTELGYMIGKGKPTIYYLPEEPEADRWDVMIGLAGTVAIGLGELVVAIDGIVEAAYPTSPRERFVMELVRPGGVTREDLYDEMAEAYAEGAPRGHGTDGV